jgi:hypothetical protein
LATLAQATDTEEVPADIDYVRMRAAQLRSQLHLHCKPSAPLASLLTSHLLLTLPSAAVRWVCCRPRSAAASAAAASHLVRWLPV